MSGENTIERGIDTFSLHTVLTCAQKDAILRKISKRKKFFTGANSYWREQATYRSNCLEEKGIKLEIASWGHSEQSGWNLFVRIKPALVLKMKPWTLYIPTKKNYENMLARIDQALMEVGCTEPAENMSICRIDVTENRYCVSEEDVLLQLHLLKKSLIPAKYRLDWFRKSDQKAKSPSIANRNSYKLQCKSMAFFAYNKTAQLQMTDQFPEELDGQHILRLEVQLSRRAILKKIGKQKNPYHELKACAQREKEIVGWFLKRLQPKNQHHVRYCEAVEMLSSVHSQKKSERMLYLLRKTSDCNNLSTALQKTKSKFNLSENQCRGILRDFEKLGISPITIPNGESI